ncbi:ABC transporter permease [Streptococcus pneumoniae]|nr:ABC transporter permease [Streptococcus pneumoniae]
MKTEIGLVLRSTGDNIPMSEANGVNVNTMKIVGYMISNGLIALCGSELQKRLKIRGLKLRNE